MALADSVSGDGTVIDQSRETGSYDYIISAIGKDDEGAVDPVQKKIAIGFTDVRETRKWYSLTLSACTTYAASNPSFNLSWTLTNANLGSYDLIKITKTRTLTSVVLGEVPTE
jgi:hypothetical protein